MYKPLSAPLLLDLIRKTEAALGSGWITWAMSNHDNVRALTRAAELPQLRGDDRALAKLLIAALLSFRGGACVYQGEELGLPEAEIAFEDLQDPWGVAFWPDFKGRDGCRTPMPWSAHLLHGGFTVANPWLPIPEKHLSLAVDQQEKSPGSVLQTFRHFARWRKQYESLVKGDLVLVQTVDSVLGFERRLEKQRMLCLFNFSNQSAVQPIQGPWIATDGHGFDTARLDQSNVVLWPFGVWFGVAGD
jgi:alpha-glucosidase